MPTSSSPASSTSRASPEPTQDLIIGTGQAGKPLAGALAEAGRRVAIVERDRVGGTCVVRGCTPTKTMVASARVAHLARRASDYGVQTGDVAVDLSRVRARKREIVDSWSRGSRKGLERHPTLELIEGEARFAGPRTVTVHAADGSLLRHLEAERIFINTGARPRIPDLPGLAEVHPLDSTSIMELDRVPEHLVILGGGFIGLEFGQMFRRFGAQVTILERADRLAPGEDEDVAAAIHEILAEDGLDIRTGAAAARVEAAGPRSTGAGDRGVRIHLEDGRAVEGSHLLVATGRVPNTDALDPGIAGVALDPRGFVEVDERLRTSAEGVWALGDVAGSPPFTHMAYDDFRVVKANLLDGGDRTTKGRIPTWTVFTDPQLGRVGLTEAEARKEGLDVRVATLPMSRVARAIEMDETRGLMKAVVEAGTHRILGAAILGIEGGEIAAALQFAMMGDLPWTALRDAPISHPTLAESLNNLFATLDE
ncbi:MAG: mercuric reductase [Gemmatimonadales bacterium]|nr:MAG: mercuric reductase [Gemmatimonadales bacterium]